MDKNINEILADLRPEITTTKKPPRKAAPRIARKPSFFDDALENSADTGEWMRFEIPADLVKPTRFEIIRAARSLDMKVMTRTGPVEQSVPGEEERKALYFRTSWNEDE